MAGVGQQQHLAAAEVRLGQRRGALDNGVTEITDEMLVKAAENLAAIVENPTPDMIIPSVFDKKVVPAVSAAIR